MGITTIGLDELISDMESLAAIPDSVIDEMLHTKADILEPAQRATGAAMGVHKTGVTLSSIKRSKSKSSKGKRTLEIYPQGTNKQGRRNAEVAFMNEYGTPKSLRGLKNKRFVKAVGKQVRRLGRMPARPFIDMANKTNAGRATEAAAKVYDAFLRSKNL